MKIRVMSDLHNEFGTMEIPELEDDKDTVLILAGDIGLAKKAWTYKEFVEDASMRFKDIIMVMGNHEHYGSEFLRSKDKMLEILADVPNAHVLEKETKVIDGYAFIGATLWTGMNNHDILVMEQARMIMNDYAKIRHGSPSEPWKRKLRPSDTVQDHVSAVHYIFEEIEKQHADGNKVVVVTHHAPSYSSVHQAYVGDPINGAYVSNLDDRLLDIQHPVLWVHGHTHYSFDYMMGKVNIVCNPRGYAPSDLNPRFNPEMLFTDDTTIGRLDNGAEPEVIA